MAPVVMERQTTTELLKQPIQIGIALTSERKLSVLLERIVSEARRFTHAEAGTLFLREGQHLRIAVIQNDALARRFSGRELRDRLGAAPLAGGPLSLAGYVTRTGATVTVPDAYGLLPDSPYAFNVGFDARTGYRTRSVLAVPLQEPAREVMGVLQLINARDGTGDVVPFDTELAGLVASLGEQAAVAVRNAMLEDLSFKDPLTGAYNRRYFGLRMEEEAKRHQRSGEPVSLALIDLDNFKPINDKHGHGAGDEVLRELTRVLIGNSRDFSIVTRYGGDEFAVLLVNTPKAGAVRYAERIQQVVAAHAFPYGVVTVSIGVASLPHDVATADELIPAADRALYAAKQAGRNTVQPA